MITAKVRGANIQLAGMSWHAWSPSMFELETSAGTVQIAFDGRAWCVGLFDGEAYSAKAFPTREAAAAMVANCFEQARRENH